MTDTLHFYFIFFIKKKQSKVLSYFFFHSALIRYFINHDGSRFAIFSF